MKFVRMANTWSMMNEYFGNQQVDTEHMAVDINVFMVKSESPVWILFFISVFIYFSTIDLCFCFLYQDAYEYSGNSGTVDENESQIDTEIENSPQAFEGGYDSDNEIPNGVMKCEFVSLFQYQNKNSLQFNV